MLPSEAIERILSFCDGETLNIARNVNHNWKQIIDYLTVKTKIWQYCCHEEIPEDQLIEYVEKFNVNPSDHKFKEIYNNWLSWQSVTKNIDFDIMLCPADVPRITCLAASGRFIAVGSEDGKVRIYNDSWDLLYTTRQLAAKVLDIKFLNDDRDLYIGNAAPFLIIQYKCSTVYLIDYEDRFDEPLIVHDVKLYSVYKKYLCFVKSGGRVSVVELIRDNDGEKKFFELTYVRIYSPNEVTGVSMWDGVCTLMINSDVKILRYNSNIQPISRVENKTSLKFCVKNNIRLEQTCQIFRHNIIISVSHDDTSQLIELFILETNEKNSKKLFHPWEVFQSYITCMYLYGNTFILGVDIGNVYFYNVDSWKSFDIRKYQGKLTIGKHPILSIDVVENKGERKFLIASSFNIHRVIGFSMIK